MKEMLGNNLDHQWMDTKEKDFWSIFRKLLYSASILLTLNACSPWSEAKKEVSAKKETQTEQVDKTVHLKIEELYKSYNNKETQVKKLTVVEMEQFVSEKLLLEWKLFLKKPDNSEYDSMDYYKIIPIFKEVTNGKNKYDVKSEKYSDSLDSEICEVLGISKGTQYTSVTVYEKDYDDKKYVSVDPKIGIDIFHESTRADWEGSGVYFYHDPVTLYLHNIWMEHFNENDSRIKEMKQYWAYINDKWEICLKDPDLSKLLGKPSWWITLEDFIYIVSDMFQVAKSEKWDFSSSYADHEGSLRSFNHPLDVLSAGIKANPDNWFYHIGYKILLEYAQKVWKESDFIKILAEYKNNFKNSDKNIDERLYVSHDQINGITDKISKEDEKAIADKYLAFLKKLISILEKK